MTSQSSMPWISGFMPTVLRVSVDSDAPMKKSVNVSDLRAKSLTAFPMAMPVSLMLST